VHHITAVEVEGLNPSEVTKPLINLSGFFIKSYSVQDTIINYLCPITPKTTTISERLKTQTISYLITLFY
jgi:hypothetical protein